MIESWGSILADLAPDSKEVAAHDFAGIFGGVAVIEEGLGDGAEVGLFAEFGDVAHAAEVAADTDVVDADEVFDVVDVLDHGVDVFEGG